ncbi:MAG TPA: LysM peptidoglycan-binding domain-containing protein [Caldilineaceae bacterium]|nr:LysM peptidoglycan-binding domain-containing protein [Caldilineaceae bacterium]
MAAHAAAQSPCQATETVVAGDTLREIANRCNTTVTELLAANPQIRNRNLIYPGQVLTIPGVNNENPNNGNPTEANVVISPNSGPPSTVVSITGRNFPPNTGVMVGIGETEAEPVASFDATTDANGAINTQIAVPDDAQTNQQFIVVIYVPGQGGDRATSQSFTTTSGEEDTSSVTIAPSEGPPGTMIQLQAGGYAPNTPVEIGFGRVESEYDVIAQAVTTADGGLNRQVRVPSFAEPNDRFVFAVVPAGTSDEAFSNVFTVTGDGQSPDPQITISPRSGPPGANVQVAVRDFPGNTRISYGLGVPGGQLLDLFSARTNRDGSVQLTLQVPDVEPGTQLEALAFVPYEGGANARSARFDVTERNDDGENLFTRTNIYLIALEDAGQSGMEIGCGDSTVPVEVEIEPTVAPLTAALGVLFGIDGRYYGQSGLYNALYRSNLQVDRIDIADGVASLYLTGDLQVGGVCDEPRIRAQLEETALQYYTVDEVRIYINGEPLSF